jgi:predicted CXXCH cytochrome family protein
MAAVFLLLVASIIWPGCSAEKHYKVLSFFFDGVPTPQERAAAAAGGVVVGQGASGEPLVLFTHEPFATENCAACHVGGVSTLYQPVGITVSATVCLKCHEQATRSYPVMHGPVAAVECLWCHAPHQADNKELLRLSSPEVCLQCHTRELLSPNPPEHMVPQSMCLDCHVGHGSEQRGLLRAGRNAAPEAPTTAPSGGRT